VKEGKLAESAKRMITHAPLRLGLLKFNVRNDLARYRSTSFLSCTVSKLWLIVGQIFASERGVPHFNALAGVIPCQYRCDISLKTRFFGLHFRCRKYWCIFNHFSVPEATEFGEITIRLGLSNFRL